MAVPKSVIIPIMSPLFLATRASMSMFIKAICSLALFVGLIKEARPDLRPLAAFSAVTPPSRIAVIITAKSSTSPPSPLTTVATLGIARDMSSIVKIVWFSTAFKKSIFDANSSLVTANAVCKEMVVSSAWL